VQHNNKGHNVAISGRDFDFFYAGLEQGKLLVQRCTACGALRNPPAPACPSCQSLKWELIPLGGRGTIYSFTVHYHPAVPDFPVPLPIALVEMEEGIRMVGAMDGMPPEALHIGLAVTVEFLRRGDAAGFRFRSA
jgi:uncharacterized OB-fold protein